MKLAVDAINRTKKIRRQRTPERAIGMHARPKGEC
jgi:hypothetical protein